MSEGGGLWFLLWYPAIQGGDPWIYTSDLRVDVSCYVCCWHEFNCMVMSTYLSGLCFDRGV